LKYAVSVFLVPWWRNIGGQAQVIELNSSVSSAMRLLRSEKAGVWCPSVFSNLRHWDHETSLQLFALGCDRRQFIKFPAATNISVLAKRVLLSV
jgi:hypothetical protein